MPLDARTAADIDLSSLPGLAHADLVVRLAEIFPSAARAAASNPLAPRGGRDAAVERLATIDPVAYARSRNHVAGAVSRLSPWIRHGVLSLAEVRDAALARVARPEDAEKFVAELGWRHYWRQVQAALGDRIRTDIEPPARAWRRPAALLSMPADVLEARTGMACIDAFVRGLHDTGWLHNHERMWLASWLVHVRGVHWLAGAEWFLEHLLDGDPASNHLSWQWVAGTFSAKPYLFNRENLETHTSGIHCRQCPLLGRCDVEDSYEALDARLFAPDAPQRPPLRIRPAAAAHPDAPRLFVVDRHWLAAERPAIGRLAFLFECLADVPGIEIRVGDPATILPARAAALGCDGIAVADTTCPQVRNVAAAIASQLPVHVVDWPPFCDTARVDDLGRFSRFWQRVSRSSLRPTGS